MKNQWTGHVCRIAGAMALGLPAFAMVASMSGCDDDVDSMEDVGERIDDAVDDAGDAVDDAIDDRP